MTTPPLFTFLCSMSLYGLLGHWALLPLLLVLRGYVRYTIPLYGTVALATTQLIGVSYFLAMPVFVVIYVRFTENINDTIFIFWCGVTPECVIRFVLDAPGGRHDDLLALCHAFGLGVKRDMDIASKLMLQARARGCAMAERLYNIRIEDFGINDYGDFFRSFDGYYDLTMAILVWHMRGKPGARGVSRGLGRTANARLVLPMSAPSA